MKNVTLRADEGLIERARQVARSRDTSLNAAFREWLEQYAVQAQGSASVDRLMRRLRHVRSSARYTPDDMSGR